MDQICTTPFWDNDLTWNTDNPDFTRCFQSTVLIWVPFAFYFLCLPFEIFKIYKHEKTMHKLNFYSHTELGVISMLLVISIVDIFRIYLSQNDEVNLKPSIAEAMGSFISSISYIIILFTMVYRKRYRMKSSGIYFIFWSILTLSSFVTYRSVIISTIQKAELLDTNYLIIELMKFPLILAIFLLSFRSGQSVSEKNESAENYSSFISRSFFWWMSPILHDGYKKRLNIDNLPKLDLIHQSKYLSSKFSKYWDDEVEAKKWGKFENKNQKPSLIKVVFKFFSKKLIYITFIETIALIFSFGNPLFLNYLIDFSSSKDPLWKGIIYSIMMFLSAAISTICLENVTNDFFKIGMEIKTLLTVVIYKKCFKMSSNVKKIYSAGEIVNLMAVDTQRISETCNELLHFWQGLIQISVSIYFLWTIIGIGMITGVFIMLLTIPLNYWLSSINQKIQISCMERKDERTKLMSEILAGIKVLKLYAWEKPFRDKILEIRDQEVNFLKKMTFILGIFFLIFVVNPYLVSLGAFTTFIFIDEANILTPNIIFVSLSLLNIMRIPMADFPTTIANCIQAFVSLKRINKFLISEELNLNNVSKGSPDSNPVQVKNGTFIWSQEDSFKLENINIDVHRNQLVAIVGSVGSGKSSIFSSILGEMQILEGDVIVNGKLAYVPQQPWIQYATLKENILFYKDMDEKTYENVVEKCCLKSDFDILPAGDKTEIGEKGINLSGGQKQRVSIARAVYQNADIYLFDDSLSAVDSHVGKDIFNNVIGKKGLLKNKTRIFVTHGLNYLPTCDYIYVMQDGKIIENGKYSNLMGEKGVLYDLISEYNQKKDEDSENSDIEFDFQSRKTRKGSSTNNILESMEKSKALSSLKSMGRETSSSSTIMDEGGKLVQNEQVSEGAINKSVYIDYMRYTGFTMASLFILGCAMFHASEIASNQWLSIWSQDNGDRSKLDYRLSIYGLTGVFQIAGILIGFACLAIGSSNASKRCHDLMLHNVIKAPMSFFDTTPMGRIMNRFARDITNIDVQFVQEYYKVVFVFWKVLGALIVISIGVPLFIVVLIPISIIYFLCLIIYVTTSRQLMRFESVTRSPIYIHFSESISGVSTIRAYESQKIFINECYKIIDDNQKCYYPYITTQRWAAAILQFLGAIIIFFTCIFVVLQRDSLDSGTIGLVVTYSITTVYSLYMGVKSTAMTDANAVSVERILEFTRLKEEADWINPDYRPNKSWPDKGSIQFSDYQVRYRDNLPLVLKGLDIEINPSEKIGIVGRTGAGKSSMTLCLFRILEAAGGSIKIDGIDISKIGLHDLRSKLTIIPQDPVLFYGTLRFNLDPFSNFTDDEIWNALEHGHFKKYVMTLKDGLYSTIQEGGENLSIGQRQLVCLVRALLRKTKILVLDEATAAIDVETDSLIQETIRKEFKYCTILTIAHRLNTIMDCDRVMVLDNGFISEFEKPSKLLSLPGSLFYSMAKDAGLI